MTQTLGWRAFSAFLFANTIIVYAASTPTGVLIVAAAFILFLFLDHRNGLLLAITCLLITLAFEATLRMTQGSTLTTYYRPHELLANNKDRNYQKNQRVQMLKQHGDLLATDPLLDPQIAQPREITFITDSLGFRNDRDYAGDKLVLVGDSFVVGIGNTQEDTITHILNTEHGTPTYNVGFPDGPHGYANRIRETRNLFGQDVCVVVLMFEGNDFREIERRSDMATREIIPKPAQEMIKNYFHMIKSSFELSRTFYGLYTRALEIMRQRTSPGNDTGNHTIFRPTFVAPVGGAPMAFLTGYADVVNRPEYDDLGYIRNRFSESRPDYIVFIPDKYRVYASLLDDAPVKNLPNAQWKHLESVSRELGIGIQDLTPTLQAFSSSVLDDGLTTFWRDDSHWNRLGMIISAQEIITSLQTSGIQRCRDAINQIPIQSNGSAPL